MSDNHQKEEKAQAQKKGFWKEYVEPLFTALLIALVIRALVIYPFRIPTGSMENSLLVGDFLLANKFVYGIRTPDWIGIPYTKIGFEAPFIRLPGFRDPKPGDVVIFKYPKDISLNYIKRCVAMSGDSLYVADKVLYVNGEKFPQPPDGKYIDYRVLPKEYQQNDIYPPGAGNRDNYGPIRIPAPGDTFRFSEANMSKWFQWIQIAVYEGHDVAVVLDGETRELTVKNHSRWKRIITTLPADKFIIDGKPLKDSVYEVTNVHYFMMGDNRDNSLDSRYWGFLPERLVVGEALIIYWSWDSNLPLSKIFKKIRWNRILHLIH